MKTREEFVNAAVDAACESHWRMEMAIFALNALLNDYDSNEDYLSATNVLEYKNSKERDKLSDNAKLSYLFLEDYKRIMWMIRVARDYIFDADKLTEKIADGEGRYEKDC